MSNKHYFKSSKYLTDVRLIFDKDTEEDERARNHALTKGFITTDEYWN